MLRLRAIAAPTIALAVCSVGIAQPMIGPITHPETGTRYYRYSPRSWDSADFSARSVGGNLTTIHDAATNEWIRQNVVAAGGNTVPCFIGINDRVQEGLFRWSRGDAPTYLNWLAGEPNNAGGAEDLVIMSASDGTWNDIPDGIPRPAVVEFTGPIRVPSEFRTIQAAIDAAVDGQTILVAFGSYVGNVDFGSKKLHIRSESGPMSTTIRVTASATGILMTGGQGPETILEGFTVVPHVAGATQELLSALNGQVIRNCRFQNPGAIAVVLRDKTVLSDSLIVGSFVGVYGTSGGFSTNATIQNCTIVDNTVGVAADNFFHPVPVTLRLINSVTASNEIPLYKGGSGNIFAFSNIFGEGPLASGPNLFADPQFSSAPGDNGIYELNDDYTPLAGSPCIDASNNSLRAPMLTIGNQVDGYGMPRFSEDPTVANTGSGPGPIADCGAFEYVSFQRPCPVDFNGDNFVDFFDYDAFVEAFELGCTE